MGRKRIVHTPEEIQERKERYWGEDRNARRRRRYAEDAEYRRTVRQQTRETYRRTRQAEGRPVRDDDCSEHIDELDDIGTSRPTLINGKEVDMVTLTVEEMAAALDRNQQVMYRWFAADMFPRPVLTAINGKRQQLVYSEAEARAAMLEFAKHQQISQYYRERHTATRDNLFAAIIGARAALGAL